MRCWFGHKWNKWSEPYKAKIKSTSYVDRTFDLKGRIDDVIVQRRKCIYCGKIQVKKLELIG